MPLIGSGNCRRTHPHIDKTVILDQQAIPIPITKITRGNTADLPRMAFSSHIIVGIILRTEVAISSILQIDVIQVLDRTHSNSLLPQEVVVATSAICSGLRQEPNEAGHRVKISVQANITLCIPLRRSLIEPHKSLLPTLTKMTTRSDLPKICKWRMKRKRTRWLLQ